jgi:hypothetical protein
MEAWGLPESLSSSKVNDKSVIGVGLTYGLSALIKHILFCHGGFGDSGLDRGK